MKRFLLTAVAVVCTAAFAKIPAPVLDDAAKRIVQMASPYSPFPPDIRRDTDILEITRTWYFTQGDQLSAI